MEISPRSPFPNNNNNRIKKTESLTTNLNNKRKSANYYPYYHHIPPILTLLASISSLFLPQSQALVFKNGLPDYFNTSQQGKSLIGANGIILDIPKIRISRYKIRNVDPHIVSDELDCDNGECGEIVEPPTTKLHLGTNSAKEANEWSVPVNVTQFVIECKSRSGVVEWDYDGVGIVSNIEIENTRVVGDFWSASTYLHISKITFKKISDRLTGKYTCRNVENPNKSNSFYLFVPQQKSDVINDARKIELIPTWNTEQIQIPCRMEKRQVPIYLFKKGSDSVYREVPIRGQIKFDPYIGFTLPKSPDNYGEYTCKIDKKRHKKKTKREINGPPVISMMPPPPPPPPQPFSNPPPSTRYSSSSPFPNSAELLPEGIQSNKNFGGKIYTISSDKVSTPLFQMTTTESIINNNNYTQTVQKVASFQPYKRRANNNRPFRRRRRKRPLLRQRHRINTAQQYYTQHDIPDHEFLKRDGPYFSTSSSSSNPPHLQGQQMVVPPPPRPRPVYHHHHHHHNNNRYHPAAPTYLNPPSHNKPTPPGNPIIDTIPINDPLVHHPPHFMHRHHHPYNPHFHKLPPPHPRLPPAAGEISGILPTYNSEGNFTSSIELRSTKIPAESSETTLLHNQYPEPFISTKLESNRPYSKPPPTKKPISLFPQNLMPPTLTVVQTMQCVLKKMVLGTDVPCNASFVDGINVAERHGNMNKNSGNVPEDAAATTTTADVLSAKDHKTILEVTVLPPPDNKFFPAQTLIYTTTPFFVKWETKFTDYANWAEINHTIPNGAFKRHRAEQAGDFENGINALEIYDAPIGETGNITVTYMEDRKEIKTHTWHYLTINTTTAGHMGLKQTVDGVVKVFMCRSATSKRPFLTLQLSENGCQVSTENNPFSLSKDYTEEDCGVGCSLLRTKIEQGVVKCSGDGVDEMLTFPEEMQCTGRPYFVDRGQTKNLTLTANGNRLLIPCVINNPNADVYLFYSKNGIVMTEVTDNSTYDLKVGFYFDTSTLTDPYGTYICTSTPDTNDQTDMVKYQVYTAEDNIFYPPQSTVFGSPPFKFMWESVNELEVHQDSSSMGKFDNGVFANNNNNNIEKSRPYVGTFEVYANVSQKEGSGGELRVVRKSDQKIIHTWRFKHIDKTGLSLDKERNLFRCQSATENPPILYAVPCDNPNVCKLERKYFRDNDFDIKSGKENSYCGNGCVQLKVWRNRPMGFVRCKGDGVDETLQYFLTENSTILTEEDKPAIEQYKLPEILNGVKRLRVGDTIDFICKANRYFYSKGFQWAIETVNGQKKFIDAKVRDDVIVKDEIRSVINLKILDAEWKNIWCYTPELTSNQWANISQPIYLR